MLDGYPLDERDLPRVSVTPQRLAQWREVAHEEVSRALAHHQSWYYQFHEKTLDGFDQIADKGNLRAYVRNVPGTTDKNVLIRASLETTLDAIQYGMYCETTFEQRCAFAHLYEDHFLDGGILHVAETRSREDPFRFVGIKYCAFRSPAQSIVASRDFIYFAYAGTARDADGQRVIYRFMRSMPMDDLQVIEKQTSKIVRGKLSYLFIYRANGSRTEVSMKALHQTAGSLPSWAATKTVAYVYPAIFNHVTVGEARALMVMGATKLNQTSLLTDGSGSSSLHDGSMGSAVSNSTSSASVLTQTTSMMVSPSACAVCYKKFRVVRPKRVCTGCKRGVCKSCTLKLFFLDHEKRMSDSAVLPLRFCMNCVVKARQDRIECMQHQQMMFASSMVSLGSSRSLLHTNSAASMSSSYVMTTPQNQPVPNQQYQHQQPVRYTTGSDSEPEYEYDDLEDEDEYSIGGSYEEEKMILGGHQSHLSSIASTVESDFQPPGSFSSSSSNTTASLLNPKLLKISREPPAYATARSNPDLSSSQHSDLSSSLSPRSTVQSNPDVLSSSQTSLRSQARRGMPQYMKSYSKLQPQAPAPPSLSQQEIDDMELRLRTQMNIFPDKSLHRQQTSVKRVPVLTELYS